MQQTHDNYNNDRNVKALFAGAAISGLFAIFYDGIDYFRVKNIPDNNEPTARFGIRLLR
jgi:hypothetical protein